MTAPPSDVSKKLQQRPIIDLSEAWLCGRVRDILHSLTQSVEDHAGSRAGLSDAMLQEMLGRSEAQGDR